MTLLTPSVTSREPSPRRIRRVAAAERLPALSRLLGRDRDHAERFLRFAAQERLSLENLWACFGDDERIEAAVLISPGHGRTAMLTISPLRGATEERAGLETARVALDEASSLDVALVQALLEPRQSAEASSLTGAGMRTLATLNYMERSLGRVPRGAPGAPMPIPEEMTIEVFVDAEGGREELSRLLQATYEDTLDCPGLAGLRTPADILEGHRRGGRFDPSMWSILRAGDRAIGAVLLNPAPQAAGSELVYLGLVPEARGRGLGRALLDRAVDACHRRGDRTIMLAVDEENAPALRLYKAAGFRRTARRVALVSPVAAPRRIDQGR